jgi:hypothetical protein
MDFEAPIGGASDAPVGIKMDMIADLCVLVVVAGTVGILTFLFSFGLLPTR